jgi:transposase InsO family protein
MKLHGNAALSWRGRQRLARRVVVEGWTLAAAAEAAGVSVRCCRKWAGRYRLQGEAGLADRSSAPRHVANRTPAERVRVIVALRSLRFTAAEIAETLEMALSTVSGILRRIQGGAGKRVRDGLRKHYNRARIDLEGRRRLTVGWEFVHIAIDDHSRLAYAEVLADEKAATAIGFLSRAVAFYRRYGITIERLLTDNGSAYVSAIHALACRRLGIRHLRTRPYRPQTNGKAERFIRTLLAGWAYGAVYGASAERTAALDGWLWYYNHRRRHSALGRQPPVSRTNLLESYT